MISLILMVTMMLSPFSMVSYAEETGEQEFPEGFAQGNTQYGNWAYQETETYIAVLTEMDNGAYLLSYTSKKNMDTYELSLNRSSFDNVGKIIDALEKGKSVANVEPISGILVESIMIEDSEAELQFQYNPIIYVEEIKEIMQEQYGAPTSNQEVYFDFDWSENPIELLCIYRVRESKYYDAERIGMRVVLENVVTVATFASEAAAAMGLPYAGMVNAILQLADATGVNNYIIGGITIERYRGAVAYSRIGSAETTGENEVFYNVTATETIVNDYIISDYNSNDIRDQIAFVESTTVYFPSYYEAEESYIIDRVRELHTN